jgi:hypothetical protein
MMKHLMFYVTHTVLLDVVSYSVVNIYRLFERTYCVHLQSTLNIQNIGMFHIRNYSHISGERILYGLSRVNLKSQVISIFKILSCNMIGDYL